MSTDNHQERLDRATARRDAAQSRVQQLQGRLAASEERVEQVKKECQERGIAPEKLPAAIAQLNKRFNTEMADFEAGIAEAEAALAPFSQEDSP